MHTGIFWALYFQHKLSKKNVGEEWKKQLHQITRNNSAILSRPTYHVCVQFSETGYSSL
jgi:hypothetical protein